MVAKHTKLISRHFLCCIVLLLSSTPSAAANSTSKESSGAAAGLERRTIETNWYHHGTGGATTHETFTLTGITGEFQKPLSTKGKLNLDFTVGGSLFTGSYEGERGITTYEGDAFGFEAAASVIAGYEAGKVKLLGEVGGSVTIVSGSAASDTAAPPYNEDFTHTLPEIYGAIGVKFPQFRFMGASSASIMYRFQLVDLGASTDYYIYGDAESEGTSNHGIVFTINFR